ncbi:DNA-directed RNA polymerase subunit alpha C-terminal domain-containing protein [Lignipirellula cremea]|uniref:DNA-directed RNA polymerase subunit alpha n=1 Tax=Lignipirellula cremea TaxID=2528010 RepID=A0A518DT24_9BACT|nr:DNA-directed RNA polymerase subunit alpha C-terminal domain-containing protein [Lignipirellula cremea]QDU95001.1 DNA-directed RNA polymerase subunit alpha [Lignipirellula cremea]
MEQANLFDLKEAVLSNNSFGPSDIAQLSQVIAADFSQHGVLREGVQELETNVERTPAVAVRLGVCYFLLGRYRDAVETLSSSDGGALAQFYLGKTRVALGFYPEAIGNYESAKKAGYNADDCAIAIAEAQRLMKEKAASLTTLDNLFGPVEQTAEYLYQRGASVASLGGNPTEVIALYERAVQIDPNHSGALFGVALENDRRGNDTDALEYYQRAVGTFPANVGSLLNLGLLYEDLGQFEQAQLCYQRVLDVFPDHSRARLYLKDASASNDMYYDEEAQKRHDRLAQVLNVPVTDFELSVRSRNCLQKMGIRTLGDLTRISEAELLASKNFGETSLVEIRDHMVAKGLELGMFAHERPEPEPTYDTTHMSPDEQAILDQPIADLKLSVRARKCMQRLGLSTIGELVRKTGDDLLESKNFGVTSLNEVREKLTDIGLKLRGD